VSALEVMGMAARDPGQPRLRTRLEHWADARSVRFAAWLLRRTHGRVLRLWRRRVVLLTTRGRRSGRLRTVPLQYFPDGQDLVVAAANGGMPSRPGWYFNLKAHPDAQAEIFDGAGDPGQRPPGAGGKTAVRAEELPPGEAAAFWPRVLQVAPEYARYPERAGRVIPLMRLVPVPGNAPPKPS
jgi:deazaflavin-dependent oxidoreductase (nitroreductase family)